MWNAQETPRVERVKPSKMSFEKVKEHVEAAILGTHMNIYVERSRTAAGRKGQAVEEKKPRTVSCEEPFRFVHKSHNGVE